MWEGVVNGRMGLGVALRPAGDSRFVGLCRDRTLLGLST